MLKDSDIDLVYIATPHSLHYKHVKMCIEYGKNVLCEKAFMVNSIQTMEILETMGEQIKMARLRRDISAELVAERANISRATLWNIEKGSPSVAIGNYAAVLHALNNMDRDLLKVAKDDEFGRKLQDLNISTKKRASNKEK